MPTTTALCAATLAPRLRAWGAAAGFADVGIAHVALDDDAIRLGDWLGRGYHGALDYMARDTAKRASPARLRPGTLTVVSARMACTANGAPPTEVLADRSRGYIARYALGRDYHRTLRRRLKALAEQMCAELGPFAYRVLTDSAPALEKALARNARLGWIGKNTLLLNRQAGSQFVLGEIYCDLAIAPEPPRSPRNLCGTCTACITACPTGAIVAPYQLDARRCISYLTIELRGSIPVEFREAIGNRIFGCDDCQLACPWNRYAQLATDKDFAARNGLDGPKLVELFGWTEGQWLQRTEGMALRRAEYGGWLRNVAVALGNAPTSPEVVRALRSRASHPDEVVREHVAWALARHRAK
ncbi:MAG TPA: tRNA epoxyqueuosine(34) reductase QueG [Verrucomicrobiae bacterium]|nr:tRNA epoxyqueuosine(34) reductase QueG [Verrucomicrobiae bacterium]